MGEISDALRRARNERRGKTEGRAEEARISTAEDLSKIMGGTAARILGARAERTG